MITWRDDDVSATTKIAELSACDDIFQQYQQPHTIGLIAAGIMERPDLVDFINSRRMIVELHGWEHTDLTEDPKGLTHLELGVAVIESLFGRRPTTLFPPWNRTSADLEAFAGTLGLVVSSNKVSLEQYIRSEGEPLEPVVNFHYWSAEERALLPHAFAIATKRTVSVKITDFGPRIAPFDHYLAHLAAGLYVLELGVDVGAHAEAMLRYARVAYLDLVDPWPNEFTRGICKGRLDAAGGYGRYVQHRTTAQRFITQMPQDRIYDAIYCDLPQDVATALEVLPAYWPRLRQGGLLGYRNYSASDWPAMRAVVDDFVDKHAAETHVESGEIILKKP